MKPVYQTIRNGPNGNCMQACIASLLELDLEEVPNFAEAVTPDLDGTPEGGLAFWERLDAWLADYGLRGIYLEIEHLEYTAAPGVFWQPPGYHLINGYRGDTLHTVVGYRGEAIHDPLEGEEPGTLEPEGYILFVSALNGAGH